ncbi:MAG: hypothetical protein JWL92_160 [Candidatus Nomurabacteria bacterium]|nr:hypothetical protein [Candidatus Nomurabacteria bacterium]
MKKYLVLSVLSVLYFSCATHIPLTLSGKLIKDQHGRYASYTTHGVTLRPQQTVILGIPSDKKDNAFRNIHMMAYGIIIRGNPLEGAFAGTSFVVKKIKYHRANGDVCIVIKSEKLPYSIAVETAIDAGELVLQKPPPE